MGTMISLGVGKLEIDWGKNNYFENYCDLFQPTDWKDIKYYYADHVVEVKKGYSRELLVHCAAAFKILRGHAHFTMDALCRINGVIVADDGDCALSAN